MVEKEDRHVVAKIHMDGHKGGLVTLRSLLRSHFNTIKPDIQASAHTNEKYLAVYGSATEKDLTDFISHVRMDDISLEYIGPQADASKSRGTDMNPKTIEYLHQIESDKYRLEQANVSLELKVDELEQELARTKSNLTSVEDDYLGAMEKAEQSEVAATKLRAQVSALTSKSTRLEREVASSGNMHERTMAYLVQFAEKFSAIEEAIGDHLYDLSRISFDTVIAGVSELGLKVESIADVKAVIGKYLTDETAEQNAIAFYDAAHPLESAEYREAKKTLDETAVLFDDDSFKKVPEDLVESMKQAATQRNAGRQDIVNIYEEDRSSFVGKIQSQLAGYEQQLDLHDQSKQLREQVKEVVDENTNIPVYFTLDENDLSYTVKAYVPVKGADSKLCDILLCENILAQQVSDLINADDVDDIQKKVDAQSNLTFYEIQLPKSEYSFNQVLGLERAMVSAVRAGYSNTGLNELGMGIDSIFYNMIQDVDSGVSKQARSSQAKSASSAIMPSESKDVPNSTASATEQRRYAVIAVLQGANGPLTMTHLHSMVQSHMGIEFPGYNIRDDLKSTQLKARIEKVGTGRKTTYALKE